MFSLNPMNIESVAKDIQNDRLHEAEQHRLLEKNSNDDRSQRQPRHFSFNQLFATRKSHKERRAKRHPASA